MVRPVNRSVLGFRVSAASGAILLHAIVVAAFLSEWRVGILEERHTDVHPSDTQTPLIASIALDGSENDSSAMTDNSPQATPQLSYKSDTGSARTRTVSAVGRSLVHCEIHIHQNPKGRVQAIDFGECTADLVWQHTLMMRIERAADLVAPAPGATFPPVRTLIVNTNHLSAVILAQQLSSADSFDIQTAR